MFALTLGHEFTAVVAAVAIIFAGMAIGGLFANQIQTRLGPKAFARLEFFIGAWGALTPLLILKTQLGWFSIAGVLPSAIAMGATLPVMARLTAIPSAYAANTFGAVTGCLGMAYVLMPRFGLVVPIFFCAGANFVTSFRGRRFQAAEDGKPRLRSALAAIFFLTGFVGLGFETLGVRLLSLSFENTVFTFAAILAVYLAGQSVGAAVVRIRPMILGGLLIGSLAISLWLFGISGSLYESLRRTFGDSGAAVFGCEILTAFAVFALPTSFMGGLFAQLANRAGQGALGRSMFWNSAGGVIGAIVVPIIILPHVGLFKTLVRVPPGSTLRDVRVGRMATVSVAETPDGNRTLFVNNRFQMGGTSATIPELRHALIPLLIHPKPERVLALGLGTGITLSGCSAWPNLHADGVELLPEVVGVMPNFFPKAADSPLNSTSVTVHVKDARRFVRETTNHYDVIIADLFHPAQDGAAFLYTREHFERIRARLSTNGIFCQWLPLHQLDLETFRDIARTFLTVFPKAEAWLLRPNIDAPVVGLIGGEYSFSTNAAESRVTIPGLARQLRRVALADSIRLYGSFLAGPETLRAFSVPGRINTDTFPIVMFEAPAFSYRRNAPTHERLMAFLREVRDGVPPIADSAMRESVASYIKARDVYLNALVADSTNKRNEAIDGYVESARMSEDFTSGYAQCLAIATAESKSNPELARKILRRLIEAQPNRPVAREMLERLNNR